MFAILPGMSRSGLTIGMGNIIGIDAKKSAEFSFIIAIPVLTGVIVKYFLNLEWDSISISINYLFLGLIISFITGLLSLRWLISLLEKGKFWYFGLYCIFIGLISLLFLLNNLNLNRYFCLLNSNRLYIFSKSSGQGVIPDRR